MTPNLSISRGDLYVWHAGLDVPADVTDRCAASLSEDELARAARFHFEHDRRRFIVARGILRRILGSLLDVEPARLAFRYGDRGKPFLAEEFSRERIWFNIAHSQAHAMFAVAADAEVGVDIEQIRPVPDAVALSDRFFSPRESSAVRALPAASREIAFLQVWTRKEAYIKAIGIGLSHPLDAFTVTVAPGEPARLIETSDDGTWWMHDLSRLPDYASAVALKAEPTRLRVGSWEIGSTANQEGLEHQGHHGHKAAKLV